MSTEQELITSSAALILARSKMTATVLSGVTYLLLRDERAMERVVKEVRNAFEREEDIAVRNVGKLTYMIACLDEAMRIHSCGNDGVVDGCSGGWCGG